MPFPYKDLREYITDLESAGELIRITEIVSAELEITEITDRISKAPDSQNKALLFENVEGYEMPVLINQMGSHKRMQMALGVQQYDQIADRIREFIKPEVPEAMSDKIAKLFKLAEARNFLPKTVTKAACQEVVLKPEDAQPMLDKLPILKCWPEDGGPFITLTSVLTKDPDSLGSGRNVGMYRLQKFDNVTTGMHWHKHHDGAQNFRKSLKRVKENGRESLRMEMAIAIGTDPVVAYAGTAPLPAAIDEMILAGMIRNKAVELVQCKTIDIQVPATAEIVLEGYLDLEEEPVTEGPFGDHTGFYSLADKYPLFHLTALTHRKNPIYATTIVGIPPQEDCYLGKATERIFLPLLQMICPEIVDMDLPWDGVFHNCALIKIDKQYAGHAQKVMNTIWGTGQMAWTKYIVVFDKEVDIHNYNEAAMHAFGNTDPQRDIMFSKGPLDILDHAAPIMGYGSKAGFDATKKWADEGFTREWPGLITMSDEVKARVDQKWAKLGL
ncbi:MAG: menaquinone biosynthesis decarboxylase [Candidatus Melainabacteria bacterium]|jgi:4-hydroxy-3-polyprenylbenzoate decarboxylase|nr:menaquinone biosynthesis decarboxylase [Candidatus Melainabacteria bacterium]